MKRIGGLLAIIFLAACGSDSLPLANNSGKVFVCKYVGTPGVDETLQTGQNPISVSVEAVSGAAVGSYFNDAQGRSLVIAIDNGQEEPDCPGGETTTTTSLPEPTTTVNQCPDPPCVPGTVNVTTTTAPPGTTTTVPGATTTTVPGATSLPPTFSFAGATTVCRAEVPTIVITFGNALPSLAGETGTLTMNAVNGGALLSTQPLVYRPGTTVELLYPGTRVNADGSIADVPGWNLNSDGLWVRDPSDTNLRDGILLTYTLNPTATATVSYPPESANCANPENPPPGLTPAPTSPPNALPKTE